MNFVRYGDKRHFIYMREYGVRIEVPKKEYEALMKMDLMEQERIYKEKYRQLQNLWRIQDERNKKNAG